MRDATDSFELLAEPLALASGPVVHVWILPIGPETAGQMDLRGLLDADEARRAARFRFDSHRDRFVATHAWLRLILARYLGCTPPSIGIAATSYGKPFLPEQPWLRFNLSQAGDLAVVAVTRNREIGVDVETSAPLAYEKLLTVWGSREERSAWAELARGDRTRSFYRAWSRKEALLKARGVGFRADPTTVVVPITPSAGDWVVSGGAGLRAYRLVDLEMPDGWFGALAAEGVGDVTAEVHRIARADSTSTEPSAPQGARGADGRS